MAFNILNFLIIILTFLPLVRTPLEVESMHTETDNVQILSASIPELKLTTEPTMLAQDGSPYTLGEMTFNGTIHGVEVEMSGTAEVLAVKSTIPIV